MTKIGLHTRIRNPYRLGYYSYLACIDSWRKIVDKIIVVDGGSDDYSIEILRRWTDYDNKISVINNEFTHWGDEFTIGQSTLNMQIGHEALSDADWIIRVDADHIIDLKKTENFLNQLNSMANDKICISFDVYFLKGGQYIKRDKPRDWIINNKLAMKQNLFVGWGKEEKGTFSDWPIIVKKQEYFMDLETGIKKTYLIGDRLYSDGHIDIKVFRYGHFFFTKNQSLAKCKIWDKGMVNTFKSKPADKLSLICRADTFGIKSFLSKENIKKYYFPNEIIRVIDKFYTKGMLGGALYFPILPKIPCFLSKTKRKALLLSNLPGKMLIKITNSLRKS